MRADPTSEYQQLLQSQKGEHAILFFRSTKIHQIYLVSIFIKKLGVHVVNKRKSVLLGLTMILSFALAFSVLEPVFSAGQSQKKMPGRGSFKAVGIGVYTDSTLSTAVSSIDWGMLEPGSSQNFTCYIRNEGTAAMVLTLSTTNWTPSSASQLITLNWNYANGSIAPNEVIKVTFTLTCPKSISGITSFSFNTVITGSRA